MLSEASTPGIQIGRLDTAACLQLPEVVALGLAHIAWLRVHQLGGSTACLRMAAGT